MRASTWNEPPESVLPMVGARLVMDTVPPASPIELSMFRALSAARPPRDRRRPAPAAAAESHRRRSRRKAGGVHSRPRDPPGPAGVACSPWDFPPYLVADSLVPSEGK